MQIKGKLLGQVFLILTCIVIFISFSLADYHYASHTGSNEYPYTSWETAADSIQNAINAASPGDTVYVGAGDYDEVLTMIDTLALIGMGWDSTYIHTDSAHTDLLTCQYNDLIENIHFAHDNFICIYSRTYRSNTIGNCKFTSGDAGILSAWGVIVVENCIFDGCQDGINDALGGSDVYVHNCLFANILNQAIVVESRSSVVTDCIFRDFPNAASYGIYEYASTSNIVMHNLFYNMAGRGCQYCDEDFYFTNNVFYNFHVWNNSATAMEQISAGIDVSNNAFVKCDIAFFPLNIDTLEIKNVNLWQNRVDIFYYSDPPPIDTVGLVRADPMFYDAEAHDFHLQAFSPLIDSGNPEILDEDGTRSDIGVFGGPGGTSYEYLDLPPRTPDSLAYRFTGDTLVIFWKINTEADFYRYIVNRDTIPDFIPWVGNIIAEPETSYFLDINWEPERTYYYRIAASDNQGNLSPYSEELSVRTTAIFGIPISDIIATSIERSYPNPFNQSITIGFTVANLGPIPVEITIEIFDILGQKIKTLNKERYYPGRYLTRWDGTDDYGSEAASGVYFVRMQHWGSQLLAKPRKIVLVK